MRLGQSTCEHLTTPSQQDIERYQWLGGPWYASWAALIIVLLYAEIASKNAMQEIWIFSALDISAASRFQDLAAIEDQ